MIVTQNAEASTGKFWNPEVINPQRTPRAVIEEAGSELADNTNDQLQFNIQPRQKNSIVVELEAPGLNYARELFTFTQLGDLVYPTTLKASQAGFNSEQSTTAICTNEQVLIAKLREFFSSRYVTSVVASLLARISEELPAAKIKKTPDQGEAKSDQSSPSRSRKRRRRKKSHQNN